MNLFSGSSVDINKHTVQDQDKCKGIILLKPSTYPSSDLDATIKTLFAATDYLMLSTLALKFVLNFSNPAPADFIIPPIRPWKFSSLTNVVAPGVVRLGSNRNVCSALRIPIGRPPCQPNARSEFSYSMSEDVRTEVLVEAYCNFCGGLHPTLKYDLKLVACRDCDRSLILERFD